MQLLLDFLHGKIPPGAPLTVTFGLIVGRVIVSLWKTRGPQPALGKP